MDDAPQRATKGDSKRQRRSDVDDVKGLVEGMLNEMENEFDEVGSSILGRMDEMKKRMDELEQSISDLMGAAGLEDPGAESFLASPKGSPKSTKTTSVVL